MDLLDSEREAFLRRESGGDDSLVAEVLGLLTHDPGSVGPIRAEASSNLVGSKIDRYSLLEILGSGGMGEVYLAEQKEPIQRKVALKIIKLGMDTKEVIARFESERQALALLDHVNIAKVLDAGATEQGRPYFVMEHVQGIPITGFCDRHRLSTRERLGLFSQVCHAIHHAHQKGIIHRDIKPSNVLVSRQNGDSVPKVIDFGVAKATSQRLTERTVFTEQGQLIGTPEYMSPEQADLTGLHVDTTSDVYSLGVLLYELITGALPFESGTLRAVEYDEIRRIIREELPPKPSSRLSALGKRATDIASRRKTSISALNRQVRGELDWIAMRAIEKDRSRRYQSASELALDVERYLRDEPVVAGPPSTAYRLTKFVKRHKRAVGSLVVVIAALAMGLGFSTTMFFRAESAREQAESEARKSERINTFLQEMLGSVNPTEQGRDVSVREVLDEAAAQIETELADQPEIQAAVRNTIGATYTALGLYDAAERHLREALATRQRVLGNEHPDVATGLNNLATLLQLRGKHAEAEPLFRQTIAMRRRLFGEEHPEIASALNDYATLLQFQGKYAEAEPVFRQALALRRKLFGEEHMQVAQGLGNLGLILRLQGKYAEAEPYYRQAIAMQRSLHGGEHPDLAANLHNLATLLMINGRYADAESLSREAVAMVKSCFGEEHPHTATCLVTLAGLLESQRKHAEAESMYKETLAIRKKSLGEEHATIALNLNDLATLLSTQGRYEEAESLYREALIMQEKILGEGHPDAARSLEGLANVLIDQGQAEQAEALLRRCLMIRRETLPEGHMLTASAEYLLGGVLVAQERYAEAETLLVGSCSTIEASPSLSTGTKREVIESVIALYQAWGKPARVAEWKGRLQEKEDEP
ncbi:tetratricopeptide repeat protein [Candidatus Eisenbacteria bacterium]|uniref:Tetratricopeptide repeat protein n=1 Tax=Eiseniibacteriota bacterium TaxID=2212470 RepID=A0ABV6YLF2_UNCEI